MIVKFYKGPYHGKVMDVNNNLIHTGILVSKVKKIYWRDVSGSYMNQTSTVLYQIKYNNFEGKMVPAMTPNGELYMVCTS